MQETLLVPNLVSLSLKNGQPTAFNIGQFFAFTYELVIFRARPGELFKFTVCGFKLFLQLRIACGKRIDSFDYGKYRERASRHIKQRAFEHRAVEHAHCPSRRSRAFAEKCYGSSKKTCAYCCMPESAVERVQGSGHYIKPALYVVGLNEIRYELCPCVRKYLSLARPGVKCVCDFGVRTADGSAEILQHRLVHVPVPYECKELRGAQLSADVGDHFHELLLSEQSVLHRLGEPRDSLHRVYDGAGGLGRLICVAGIGLYNVAQPGYFTSRPGHALVYLGLGVADDVEHERPESPRGLRAAALCDCGDGAYRGCQLVYADVRLRRDRSHNAEALCNGLYAGCVFVIYLVRAVEYGGELAYLAVVLVGCVD